MMIIKGMRWGYDGGGIACGPVEGSLYAEIMVADENGCLHFVEASQFTDCFKVIVSPSPLFDLSMNMMRTGINFDHEFSKVEKMASEIYDYEMYDYPAEMLNSKFLSVIKLLHKALEVCSDDDGEDFEGAQEFINEYLDQDADQLTDLELPEEEEPIDC